MDSDDDVPISKLAGKSGKGDNVGSVVVSDRVQRKASIGMDFDYLSF